jgi:hypothetical protein
VKHSVLSWDCCYRNFFHTAEAFAHQTFASSDFEVIYVEQRTEAASDAHNHGLGLPSLREVVSSLADRIGIRVLYLGDDANTPFHWGRAVNAGIKVSSGAIISVMDGDLLLEPEFLSKLDRYHAHNPASVVNLHRRMVPFPIGVPRDRWTEQRVTFDACLAACPDRDQPLPAAPNNYGPMISAHREHWVAIGGYDENPIWGSGLSLLGTDVTRRLEIEVNAGSRLLPDTFCVHPWHPVGFQRHTLAARRILALQQSLIDWTIANRQSDWRKRQDVTTALYEANRRFIDRVMRSDIAFPSISPGVPSRIFAWASGSVGRLVNREFGDLRGDISTALKNVLARRP